LETARPMVRSTNTGRSAFIDYKGHIVSALPQFRLATLRADIQGRSGATPFLFFARIQPWLAAVILLILALAGFFPKKSITRLLGRRQSKRDRS